ncbi:MAG: methionine adenosyltransferase [Candidatus Palauibacterales bacterium]|nr:methionine adenosyltransferase [Candidatus Palauibacterales bacterium]MDP2584588.1 methionine adenosyltransferase [Candidatus Palauibacterales bacterium]
MSSSRSHHFFTSESVTEGHPDKVADQISDAVLDAMLAEDPDARVACETLVTTGLALLAGEVTTSAYVHLPEVVRDTIRSIGYDDPRIGFAGDTCAVLTSIDKQSPDIAMGVDRGGAGDQGMMFGYATDETPEFMPLPISLAHRLTRRLATVRRDGTLPWLRPDGKAQVTVEYDDGHPVRVSTVVVSAQHTTDPDDATIREGIRSCVIDPVLPVDMVDPDVLVCHINPTGRFVIGGPQGDAGVTGRKIIVDTYGGVGSHGGGAFSGKDPSKVDRSASYAARWVAKNLVAAGLAHRAEIQIAYAIGVAEPVSVMVDSFDTGEVSDEDLVRVVESVFDLRPAAIIAELDLKRPIYRRTAAYGHFGRQPEADGGFSWERTDRVDALREAI